MSDTQSIDAPHQRRPFPAHTHLDVVNVGDFAIGRGVFEPCWRWSNDVKAHRRHRLPPDPPHGNLSVRADDRRVRRRHSDLDSARRRLADGDRHDRQLGYYSDHATVG